MTHKITGPVRLNTVLGHAQGLDARTRLIWGIGYTDDPATIDYCRNRGFQLDLVDEVPEAHRVMVEKLDELPQLVGTPTIDAQDPDSEFRRTLADGHTTIDIRDIIGTGRA
jgi:hypothetical protein